MTGKKKVTIWFLSGWNSLKLNNMEYLKIHEKHEELRYSYIWESVNKVAKHYPILTIKGYVRWFYEGCTYFFQ